MNGVLVQAGPFPSDSVENLAGKRLVNHSADHFSFVAESKGYRTVPKIVNQVCGAVHRIQDPECSIKINVAVILFLSHKLEVRPFLPQSFFQEFLYLVIHLCDVIRNSLHRHLRRRFFIGKKRLCLHNKLNQLFHIYFHFIPSLSYPRITQVRGIENILRTF